MGVGKVVGVTRVERGQERGHGRCRAVKPSRALADRDDRAYVGIGMGRCDELRGERLAGRPGHG